LRQKGDYRLACRGGTPLPPQGKISDDLRLQSFKADPALPTLCTGPPDLSQKE